MNNKSIKTVLVVEDNPGDARLLREMFNEQDSKETEVSYVECLSEAEKYLSENTVDIILLDLGLPDAQGLKAVRRARMAAPHIPLVVLTGLDDESLAIQTLQEGAQDYLIKGQIESRALLRALRYAIERKHMEVELATCLDVAIESVRIKAEFLANMSHEIRTPMNGVIGMTELLLDTELDADQRDFAETIQFSGEALLTIINDILDFSKIEAGKLNFENIDFDLNHVVQGAVEILAQRAHVKTIELVSLVENDVHTRLRGDPGRIRQVITNLLGNAVKFTEQGEVFIRVTKENETSTHVVLRFAISDTGIGISEAGLKRLFQAFSQADGTTSRRYGGTGLGLAISKQLVELMVGKIGVESTFGQGSTFWFTLKLEKQLEQVLPVPPVDIRLEGVRILIVADNATNGKVLMHQTNSRQMRPQVVENGLLALELLNFAAKQGEPYEIVIMDIQKPGMNAYQLASAIKNNIEIANVKLVHFPAFGYHGDADEARQAGIAAYLTKPVKQSQLYDCLIKIMSEPPAQCVTQDPSSLVTQHSLTEAKLLTVIK